MLSFLAYLIMGSSQSLQSAVEVVSNWHPQPRERLIFDCGRAEVSQYLQAVVKIRQSASDNDELKDIISMAVSRLKHEFRTVLTRQTDSAMGSNSTTELSSLTDSTGYQFRYEDFVVHETPSAEVIRYLRSIAETMDSCGHLDVCIEVYKSVRRPFVNAVFKRLRLDELKAGDVKRFLWEELKMKIERWIEAARVCTKILFTREKQFAAQIFSGLGRTATHEECFLYTAKDAAVCLFSFAESVSLSHQSPERLEAVLMLYEVMVSLAQDVGALFPSESAKAIPNGTAATLSRLEDEVRRMLSAFENAVLHELSTISDDGGRVHPLTKHVMGYVNLMVVHRKNLVRLIVSRPSMTIRGQNVPDSELQDPTSLSPLTLHLVLIIAVLQSNLEHKSEYFKDPSLRYLFMMNNVRYIVQKIEGSGELQELISADYLKKLDGYVKGAMTSYQEITCGRLLNCLRDEGLYVCRCFTSQVSIRALRKRIKIVNIVFEEIRSLQSSREVQDLGLREELRRSMLEKLMPAYEGFLMRFSSHLESGKQRKMCLQYVQRIHVKYSLKDLEELIMTKLFARHRLPPSSDGPVENSHLGGG
ncbi:exocyst complex component EXO70B1-like [Coffea eugenioides]|uniref:exocyst complex component EXO70B1-like n=1 Tax=Coffea eugenioides TaxID=49369 RepID=UPI000F6158C7|nr:exocyst complex component EXO70B1-like [Coffea eugenioides]